MPCLFAKRVLLTAALAAMLGTGGYLFFRERDPGGPPLTAAPVAEEKAQIRVDTPAQVSKANQAIPHQECVIAADPTNPGRLLAAAIYSSDKWGQSTVKGKPVPTRGIAGYYSGDGGKTWKTAFERKGEPEHSYLDPTLAFGPDGTAYFVCMRLNMKVAENKDVLVGDPDAGALEFTRSSDGGKTWGLAADVPPHTDRPWIAVDGTTGRYRGRLYCLGNLATTWDLFSFPRSDTVKEFSKASLVKTKGTFFRQSSNLVVLSDGAVVFAVDQRVPDKNRRPVTTVLLSSDGGQTLEEVGRVNTAWSDPRYFTINRLFFPQLAADTQTPAYLDRLYYVWEDGGESARILFSASRDRGRSWTAPLVLSEQANDGTREQDYRTFMPSIAVNKQGVVAVSWYDRRSLPEGSDGYHVRLRVSLDGGASWLPSVQLQDKPCRSSLGALGDTAGLAADAEGCFHPVWIDDRTGIRQLWTARVRIERK